MERIVNVGIIGCGGIALGKHMPSLKTVPNVRMVAFCDIIPEKAEYAAKEYGTPDAKVYTDYKELLKDESIEVVHVLTPNREHAQISIDSLYAGKHVMCEKPMAKTAADALRMCEAAEATGKKLTIGYQSRYRVDSQYAKAYIDSGAMGEIYYANSYALRRRATPNWGVFLDADAQGGGPVIDIATHSLDLTLYLMNNYEPKMVVGKTHKRLEHPEAGNIWGNKGVSETELEEAACAMIIMKNGATIMLETSWALNIADPREAICTLCGTKAGLDFKKGLRINKVELNRQVITEVDTAAGGVAFYDGTAEEPTDVEQRVFYDAITKGTSLTVKPEQALVVTQILEAIYNSAKLGKTVYFE